jgi:hypothetical protein
LVENISGSLQEEMRAMRDEVREGFNRVDSASRRHGALLASGTIAIAGLTKSATKRDTVDKRRDAEIRDLKARVKKLESIVHRRKAS